MARRGDFYEDDESVEDLLATSAHGQEVVTAPPSRGGTASSAAAGRSAVVQSQYIPEPRGQYCSLDVRQASVVVTSSDWASAVLEAPLQSSAVPSRS